MHLETPAYPRAGGEEPLPSFSRRGAGEAGGVVPPASGGHAIKGAPQPMENFAFQGLIGLSLAMYLWLISAGLTIIFGVLRIVNFAHGSLFMVGAYLAYTFYGQLGLPFGVAIVLSLLGTGLLRFGVARG